MRRLLYRFACWLKALTEDERIHWCRDASTEHAEIREYGVGVPSGEYTLFGTDRPATKFVSLRRGQTCPDCRQGFS